MPDRQFGDYLISIDQARLDPKAAHSYLSSSYWSEGIPLEVVRRALENSLCIGAYTSDGNQVGLVRIITDRATYAYLCDVYVLEMHRRRGLAKAMLKFGMELPELQGLRSWNLRTRDAHAVYESLGFKVIDNPEGYMILRFPDAYRQKPPLPANG